MFNHLLNELIHYWLTHPESTPEDTLAFALKEQMVEKPSEVFLTYITEEHNHFCKRSHLKKGWDPAENLDLDDTPIGANPFMSDDPLKDG